MEGLSLFVAQALALNGIDLTVIGRHPEKLENFSHFAKQRHRAKRKAMNWWSTPQDPLPGWRTL